MEEKERSSYQPSFSLSLSHRLCVSGVLGKSIIKYVSLCVRCGVLGVNMYDKRWTKGHGGLCVATMWPCVGSTLNNVSRCACNPRTTCTISMYVHNCECART